MSADCEGELLWWGYRHANGGLHVKRWFGDHADYTTDCEGNDFVAAVLSPFPAANRDEALAIVTRELGLSKVAMNFMQLKLWLHNTGWVLSDNIKDTGVDWYAYKRFEGLSDCALNNRPPAIVLTPYEIDVNGGYSTVELSVCGAVAGGQWLDFKAYSIPLDQVEQVLPQCVQLLIVAWNAAVSL